MGSDAAVFKFIEALNAVGTPYMLVGSLSSNAYSRPRATEDADFVIEAGADIEAIRKAVAGDFRMEPQLGFETRQMTARYLFQHVASAFTIEVFILSDDAFDRHRFAHRQTFSLGGVSTCIPQAEDVVIQKARWGRLKDKFDIAAIIQTQGDALNWAQIEHWARQHGSWESLVQIREHLDDYQ